jgi:hypothetical protein
MMRRRFCKEAAQPGGGTAACNVCRLRYGKSGLESWIVGEDSSYTVDVSQGVAMGWVRW